MKNKRIVWMLTAGLTFGMLTGCGGEEKKTYDQACADLAQGSYEGGRGSSKSAWN